jgi:phenylalanyl-tRNA synthetase alpha chain
MDTALSAIEKRLQQYPFLTGFEKPTSLDRLLFIQLKIINHLDANKYPSLIRWKNYLASFSEAELQRLPLVKCAELSVLIKQVIIALQTKSTKEERLVKMSPKDAPMPCGQTDAEMDLPQLLLNWLNEHEKFDSIALAEHLKMPHQKIIGGIKSILTHDRVINTEDYSVSEYVLTDEGKSMAKDGSHEYNLFQLLGTNGMSMNDIKLPNLKVAQSKALEVKWISIEKNGKETKLVRKVDKVEDTVSADLKKVADGKAEELNKAAIEALKKRKALTVQVTKGLKVSKGENFVTTLEKPELDLTAEMLANGSWATKTFKKYNFDALGIPPPSGHYHPLLKVRTEFRQIFLEMGFSEMPTNRYVESSFWNFDALFQPQQHPARDAHDTFFVSDPEISTKFPEEYLERVKKVHAEGGYGSVGYQYDWKIEEAQKNVLRTHTTACSARQLYLLAQQKEFKPAKMFSIDRVFRNETLDATHLAEFHQVEGVVAEKNLSLGHVIGLFTEFFRKCGIQNLKFKPTYNPYTEPSMEIFAYHEGFKKWVEIGNSGLFRPEMLLPMGLPPDVNVAGFGLSLERPTMIRYGFKNIRELFGPKVDIEMIYKNPICRLEKE